MRCRHCIYALWLNHALTCERRIAEFHPDRASWLCDQFMRATGCGPGEGEL